MTIDINDLKYKDLYDNATTPGLVFYNVSDVFPWDRSVIGACKRVGLEWLAFSSPNASLEGTDGQYYTARQVLDGAPWHLSFDTGLVVACEAEGDGMKVVVLYGSDETGLQKPAAIMIFTIPIDQVPEEYRREFDQFA